MSLRQARASLALAILSPAVLSAEKESVPYAEFYGPLFGNESVNFSCPGHYRSIRDVDYRNLTLHVFGSKGKPPMRVPLKDGKWTQDKDQMHDEVGIEEIHYLPKQSEAPAEYALLIFSWFSVGGSSSKEGYAQVFRLSNRQLSVVQQLYWDEHFQTKQYYVFDKRTLTLTIRSAHYLPGDAHCCVSAMDVVTLHWNGRRLVEASKTTELSDYGKGEKKTLTRGVAATRPL